MGEGKNVRPSASNRAEVFNEIKRLILGERPQRLKRFESAKAAVLRATKLPQVMVEGADFFNQGMGVVAADLLSGDLQNARALFQDIASVGCYVALAEKRFFEEEIKSYDKPAMILEDLFAIYFVSSVSKAEFLDSSFKRHLQKLVDGRASESFHDLDSKFLDFMRFLVQCDLSGALQETPESMRENEYFSLIDAIIGSGNQKGNFERYFDFKWSHSFGWGGVDAVKKRRTNQIFPSSYFREVTWRTVIPFEIPLMMNLAGKELDPRMSIDCEHFSHNLEILDFIRSFNESTDAEVSLALRTKLNL